MKKIENKKANAVFFVSENYIVIIPVMKNNVLCPDCTRRAVLLCGKSDKIEYIFGRHKHANYGHGFPEQSRLELVDVLVNGKSSWSISERYHKHVPCNVDKIVEWLVNHYADEFLGAE